MSERTTPGKSDALAVDHLAATLVGLGLGLEVASGQRLLVSMDGHIVPVTVRSAAYATPAHTATLIGAFADPAVTPVLVADRITEAAREMLRQAGWGWFDRRGHLFLRAPGVLIDRDVSPAPRPKAMTSRAQIVGLAGRTVAYELLLRGADPGGPFPVRASASRLGISPASVSTALARLREVALLGSDGRPLLPELFWALADVWRPPRTWLRSAPSPEDRHVNSADLEQEGWCATGTAAALAWGAPLVAAGEIPADLYVPSPVQLSVAARRYGTADQLSPGSPSIAVAPVSAITSFRLPPRPGSPWPLAHPVAVALDLAQDRSRGVEILQDWTPPEGYERVW